MILLFFFPFFAFAEDCKPTDNLWEKARLWNPPSQGNTELCYAHAVANLLSLKSGQKIDPKFLAETFSASENPLMGISINGKLIEKVGGLVGPTLELALAKGVCVDDGSPCPNRFFVGSPRAKHQVIGEKHRAQLLGELQRILTAGEPVILSLNLGFLRADGANFLHGITLVGVEKDASGECYYVAVDSNRSSSGWKPEYQGRLSNGFLRLKGEELRASLLRVDYVRGPLRLSQNHPVSGDLGHDGCKK